MPGIEGGVHKANLQSTGPNANKNLGEGIYLQMLCVMSLSCLVSNAVDLKLPCTFANDLSYVDIECM